MTSDTQADEALRQRFIGMWRCVSVTHNGGLSPDRGANPTGYIVYHPSGAMAAQIMPSHPRPKFASREPTPEEAKAAFFGYIAYFGTFSVDVANSTVIHHRQGSLNPSTIEDVVRRFEFIGDNRVVLNPLEHPAKKITWERLPD